jgi:hypothetical protein
MSRPRFISASFAVLSLLAVGTFVAADKPPAKKAADKPSVGQAEDPFAEGRPSAEKPHPHAKDKWPGKIAPSPAAKHRQLRCGEAAIEEALAKPISLEYVETPLADVIDDLKDRCGIEIQLDKRCLDDVGVGTESPITINLQNVPLRSALNLMLRSLGLTWMIRHDVLLITTPQGEENSLTTKVYDVSDLVVCRDEHDAPWDDYETLIELINTTIMPTSWDAVGGPGSIEGASVGKAKVLVVSQTYHIQYQVAELLAEIRKIAKRNPDTQIPHRNKPTSKPTMALGARGGDGMF